MEIIALLLRSLRGITESGRGKGGKARHRFQGQLYVRCLVSSGCRHGEFQDRPFGLLLCASSCCTSRLPRPSSPQKPATSRRCPRRSCSQSRSSRHQEAQLRHRRRRLFLLSPPSQEASRAFSPCSRSSRSTSRLLGILSLRTYFLTPLPNGPFKGHQIRSERACWQFYFRFNFTKQHSCLLYL